MNYTEYLKTKEGIYGNHGFEPVFMPDYLFDFQKALIDWAVRKGRGAIFADCGLGKSIMEMVWAENIIRKTNGNVLLLTPIAVGQQMIEEAKKFDISDISRSRDGTIKEKITVSNYERLHYFNPQDFTAVICDESSILKNFDGITKHNINMFVRKIPYRLLATATAAPNDFIELGTSSEALGYMGYMDMLSKFFKNDQNNCATNSRGRFTEQTKWRLKGHAHDSFWRWVTGWSRAMRKPSDLGFSNDGYNLPKLNEIEHCLDIEREPNQGELFTFPAVGLKEVRDERRHTVQERCEYVADIINKTDDYAVVWCNLNDEGDILESRIKDCIQISGRDTDESKEEKLHQFTQGKERVLVTKPKIGAWGLNWQHCNKISFFPAYSYEQYYQAIRRCLRYGQKREVEVDLTFTNGDKFVIDNLRRKQQQADTMFTRLVGEMNNSLYLNNKTEFTKEMESIKWL